MLHLLYPLLIWNSLKDIMDINNVFQRVQFPSRQLWSNYFLCKWFSHNLFAIKRKSNIKKFLRKKTFENMAAPLYYLIILTSFFLIPHINIFDVPNYSDNIYSHFELQFLVDINIFDLQPASMANYSTILFFC